VHKQQTKFHAFNSLKNYICHNKMKIEFRGKSYY